MSKDGKHKSSEDMDRERRAAKKRRRGGQQGGSKPWQRSLQAQLAHEKEVQEFRRRKKADRDNYDRVMRQGSVRIPNPTEQERDDWIRLVNNNTNKLASMLLADCLIVSYRYKPVLPPRR